MNLGDWQLGSELPVVLQATDGTSPAWPDAAPQLVLYNGTTFLKRILMSADPQAQSPGLFRLNLFLDASYPASGQLNGAIQWTNNGNVFSQTVWLRIIPGGDSDGSVIAMAFVRRPSASFVLWQTDAGVLFRGSNPNITR